MANIKKKKGTIAILTGGGDVPGLNPAIRAVTIRAILEGYRVIGLARGWAGLLEVSKDEELPSNALKPWQELTIEQVNRVGRTGGTFLHTSRTNPAKVKKADVPPHLRDAYNQDVNDLTPDVLKNIDKLGIDYVIPIGGDDTLSYGLRLHNEGVKVIAIPKTMDNDVPGTDYCIGFSTCLTRTIEMTHRIRTTAGSHERIVIIEVFGRYAGYTSLLPTMAGAASRCVIPESPFDIDQLTDVLVEDRNINPSLYSICLVSEGATIKGENEMVFEGTETDAYGHRKLGGIGDLVSAKVKELSAKYNKGQRLGILNQRLGYLVRCGDPDAIDSIVPMAFGNLALNLILDGRSGRMVNLRNGRYDNVPIDVISGSSKKVDVDKYYNRERLRPIYTSFDAKPLFIMTSDF
jgi:6-phosphofructokinase 1